MSTRRDLSFSLPADRIADWNGGSVHVSHFMNTLSLFFPEGERFFIAAVRDHRGGVADDAALLDEVAAFIGQEAMHGREHRLCNAALFARHPEAARMEAFVKSLLRQVERTAPPAFRLSVTMALEHLTAIMADGLLSEPRLLAEAEPAFAALWTWHALEETEHKAVAFDVWNRTVGHRSGAYALRAGGLIIASVVFWALCAAFYLRILAAEGVLTDRAGWRQWGRACLGEVGFLRKLARPWADYLRPGFHPWDRDNRHLLSRLDALAASFGRVYGAAA